MLSSKLSTKVLLIEDSDSDARLVLAQLSQDASFGVTRVDQLSEGCASLQNGVETDVVVLDLNLPDSVGLETFTRLQDAAPETPVVILSGNEDDEMAVAAVHLGAQDYVPKDELHTNTLARSLRYAIERSARMLAERHILQTEGSLAAARKIQQHLLPSESPQVDGYQIAGLCHPAEATGGDFFDYIPLAGGAWDLLVADVSGHGFAPALIMAGARRMLRTVAQLHDDLGEVVAIANRAVAEDTLDDQLVTLFVSRLDPVRRQLRFVGAGHDAYVVRACGGWTQLPSTGLPLGVQSDTTFEVGPTVDLQSGDIVLLLTDGVTEAQRPNGELFGAPRALEIVRDQRAEDACTIAQQLLQAAHQFCFPATPQDDVTIVLQKVL